MRRPDDFSSEPKPSGAAAAEPSVFATTRWSLVMRAAYGGPYACNWLNVVPLVPVDLSSISAANNLLSLTWFAVPRSTYQIQYATNLVNGSNNWQNLTNGQAEALGTPTSLSVAPYPPTNTMQFYRIQSLGRAPGN